MHRTKHYFKLLKQQGDVFPAEYFSHEAATWLKEQHGNVQCCKHQLVLNELIEVVLAEDVRSTVADNKVHAAFITSKSSLYVVNGLLSCDITLKECCSLDWSHFEKIYGNKVWFRVYIDAVLFQTTDDYL